MNERAGCIGVGLYVLTGIMPLLAFFFGWIGWDLKIGIMAAIGTFMLFFIIGTMVMCTVKDPGWLLASLPFAMSLLYLLLPDFIIGGFDDTAVLFFGLFGSMTLFYRKLGVIPWEAILPFSVVAIYPLVGQFMPGPVDEFLVTIIGSGIGASKIYKYKNSYEELQDGKQVEIDEVDDL